MKQYLMNLAAIVLISFIVSSGGGDVAAAPGDTGSAHRESYLIRFRERGLMHYAGSIAGLKATAPRAGRKLDPASAEARAYLSHLEEVRAEYIDAIAQSLGRSPVVTHSYAITGHGIAAAVTSAEAGIVATIDGVTSVGRAGVEHVQTFRGPSFIGAPAVWDGSSTPTGIGTRGEGVVVGVIDTGAAIGHPSFADDASCGHDAAHPKLLGAVDCSASNNGQCTGPNPLANSGNGHGIHVAGAAVGNIIGIDVVPPPMIGPDDMMSGVAPCAQLRSYKACETTSCDGAAILAAIENAIADGVDVVNFSISGGLAPWESNDFDRIFLDAVDAGILVAAAAGNTSAGIADPIGKVNHLAPWVLSVAASTHDRNAATAGVIKVTGPVPVPAALQNLVAASAVDAPIGETLASVPIRFDATNSFGCTAFAPEFFDDAIALISRGECVYGDKVANAFDAGAVLVLIHNNEPGGFGIATGGASLPTYGIEQAGGQALAQFIQASASQPVLADFDPALVIADMLASFSLRGPTSSLMRNLTKPDIAAPGVNIYSAMDPGSNDYGYLSGTSMSSPHLAGALALMRSLHPGWTPMEIASAVQTTAVVDGLKDDGFSAWDADDVGSGRIDLTRAALAGLVLDETYENFLAANPSAGNMDLRELNLPSIRDVECSPSCTFTRTVTNRLNVEGTWTAHFVGTTDHFSVQTVPSSFTLAPGQSQVLSITAAPSNGMIMNRVAFGRIELAESQGRSPMQHLRVAVQGEGRYDYIEAANGDLEIQDSCAGTGQSNGVIEPGESATLRVPLRVSGRLFESVEARLALPAPEGVTYLSSSDFLGDISPGQNAFAAFDIQLASSNACLADIDLPIVFISGDDVFASTVHVDVGLTGDEVFAPAGLPVSIPDGSTAGVASQIEVLQDIPLADLTVEVSIDHNWIGDLRIVLRSPAGTEIPLLDRPGHPQSPFGCGNRQMNAVFRDGGIDPEDACAPGASALWPVALAAPLQPLAQLASESSVGTWTLVTVDAVDGYGGRLLNWRLVPAQPFEGFCSICDEAESIFADGFEVSEP